MRFSTSIVYLIGLVASVEANAFLDIYLHLDPTDDFCGAKNCNITYALSILTSQNQFDLQSLKLQEGVMRRNERYHFEDNTVFRLNNDLFNTQDKIYLGLSLFDVPEDMQDYIIVDVTDVINKGRRARIEFISETMKTKVHVYRRHEAMLTTENDDTNMFELDTETEHPILHQNHPIFDHGCTCKNMICSCCRHVKVARKVRLDDIVCVNMTYVPERHGFQTALSVHGHIPHFSKEIIAGDSLPVCFEMLKEYASLCLRLYNFERHEKEISVCTEVEARLYHVKVARKKIGCLRMAI